MMTIVLHIILWLYGGFFTISIDIAIVRLRFDTTYVCIALFEFYYYFYGMGYWEGE